jgi:hypothetical protein
VLIATKNRTSSRIEIRIALNIQLFGQSLSRLAMTEIKKSASEQDFPLIL